MKATGAVVVFALLMGVSAVGYARDNAAASIDCDAYIDAGHKASDYHDLNANPVANFTGLGKLLVPGRGCYVGNFSHGFPAKTGVQAWPDGSIYRGEFKTAGAHGEGVFTHRFGWSYRGTWTQDWPISGTCSLDGEVHSCEATEGGPDYRNWTTNERITIPMLKKRYFDEFNLLRATAPLRSSLNFRGKEYDLVGMLPDRKGRVYYAGSERRSAEQVKEAFKPHRSGLRRHHSPIRDDYDDRTFSFEIELSVAPSGAVESCSTDHYPGFCEELGKIDFGIVRSSEPLALVIEVDRYAWILKGPASD